MIFIAAHDLKLRVAIWVVFRTMRKWKYVRIADTRESHDRVESFCAMTRRTSVDAGRMINDSMLANSPPLSKSDVMMMMMRYSTSFASSYVWSSADITFLRIEEICELFLDLDRLETRLWWSEWLRIWVEMRKISEELSFWLFTLLWWSHHTKFHLRHATTLSSYVSFNRDIIIHFSPQFLFLFLMSCLGLFLYILFFI